MLVELNVMIERMLEWRINNDLRCYGSYALFLCCIFFMLSWKHFLSQELCIVTLEKRIHAKTPNKTQGSTVVQW